MHIYIHTYIHKYEEFDAVNILHAQNLTCIHIKITEFDADDAPLDRSNAESEEETSLTQFSESSQDLNVCIYAYL